MYSLLEFLSKPNVNTIFDKMTFLKETLRHKLCEFYYSFGWIETKDYYKNIFNQDIPPENAVDKSNWGDAWPRQAGLPLAPCGVPLNPTM